MANQAEAENGPQEGHELIKLGKLARRTWQQENNLLKAGKIK